MDPWTTTETPLDAEPGRREPPRGRRTFAVLAIVALLIAAIAQAASVAWLTVIPELADQLFIERKMLYDPEDNTLVFVLVWAIELVVVPLVASTWLLWLSRATIEPGLIAAHIIPGFNLVAPIPLLLRFAGTWRTGRKLVIAVWAAIDAAVLVLLATPLATPAWRSYCDEAGIATYRGRDWCDFVRIAWHHMGCTALLGAAAILALLFVAGIERRAKANITTRS